MSELERGGGHIGSQEVDFTITENESIIRDRSSPLRSIHGGLERADSDVSAFETTRLSSKSTRTPNYDNVSVSSSRYAYSFSGADANVHVWFPQLQEQVATLDSVHTISVSVHEAKGQTRALGYRGIRGLSRGVRTIAGSLILTVINDHPLHPLMKLYTTLLTQNNGLHGYTGWSIDRELTGVGTFLDHYAMSNMLPTLLPAFDLSIYYVSEMANVRRSTLTAEVPQELPDDVGYHGFKARDRKLKQLQRRARRAPPEVGYEPESAGLLIRGIEFIDDGLVTSVNDIVSEMTFSFIACDYKPLARFDVQNMGQLPDNMDVARQKHQQIMRNCYGG